MKPHFFVQHLWKILCAILAALVLFLVLLSWKLGMTEKIVKIPVEKIVEVPVEKIVERIVKVESPPKPLGISRETDLEKTSKGFSFRSRLKIENGTLASIERKQKTAYTAEHTLTVRVPRAAATMAELEEGTPELSRLLPGLESMVEKASVSDFFEKIYANKTKRLRKNSAKLGSLLTSHNFFDCQTILNLTAPTGRKVFLMQGDMDVVSDGSDGDRLAQMPEEIVNSTHYQPTTSYGWAKIGNTQNPLIAGYQRRIVNARKELADATVSKDRKDWVRSRIKKVLEPGIEEMGRRSFLIAEYDPFIVIPLNVMIDRRDQWGPKVGDYAVVIHNGVIYPAIIGDAGPTFKIGEASLRMARQIDNRSSPYRRPVSELSVTYLCFPRTAEKPHRPPNYEFWHSRCQELLDEVGGLAEGVDLFEWEDLLPKPSQPEEPSKPEVEGLEITE